MRDNTNMGGGDGRPKYSHPGGGTLHIKGVGMLVGNFELRANVGKYRESQISSKNSNFG